MKLELFVDRETAEKLADLRLIFQHKKQKQTLALAQVCYQWYLSIKKTGWSIASLNAQRKYRLFERDYCDRGLFAPPERKVVGDITDCEETMFALLLKKSEAADLSAMTTEAIWLLADIAEKVSDGETMCAVNEETGEFCIFEHPEFAKIRP